MLFPIPECAKLAGTHFNSKTLSSEQEHETVFGEILKTSNPKLFRKGGRKEALKILNKISKLKNYGEDRDIPAKQGTSGLSAHHKFGTVSVRETFWAAREQFELTHPFISQLYWRDFFHHIAFHFPKVFGHAFQEKFEDVEWDEDEERFAAWCEGRTGFPIVDAAMRELNTTGYMHNRCRMIVASFLVKDLLLDWRKGERYFATQLVDYDPCVNNGSWQWAASTGCDAQPYFRIFNPWRQQIRFDPDAEYIKKWVPELKDVDPKTIHRLNEQRPLILQGYPRPIVNHRTMAEEAKSRYKQAS
jgi:deoxyribodipyrimidine photo-lyase